MWHTEYCHSSHPDPGCQCYPVYIKEKRKEEEITQIREELAEIKYLLTKERIKNE